MFTFSIRATPSADGIDILVFLVAKSKAGINESRKHWAIKTAIKYAANAEQRPQNAFQQRSGLLSKPRYLQNTFVLSQASDPLSADTSGENKPRRVTSKSLSRQRGGFA